VLAAIGNETVVKNTMLTFTANATDGDKRGQTLKFSLISAPRQGASNQRQHSGVFTWSTDNHQENYTFKVRVTDNGSACPLGRKSRITVTGFKVIYGK
jgi:hypothetical protein